MNFEKILEHHLLDHRYATWMVGGVDMGLTRHLVMLWIVSAVTIAMLTFAARGRGGAALVARTGVEATVVYIRDTMLRPIFHEATNAYLPYFLTLFFFLLVANLVGLIPFASSVTGNVSVTAAMAGCTFFLIHFAGIKEQGIWSYIKHIVPSGLPWWIVPLLFAVEVLGLGAKCVALCIRIFANMIAGHVVSLAFLSLIFIFAGFGRFVGLGVVPVAVGLALFIYALDILVSLVQAYVFTVLTALFVGSAVHPH